LQCHRQAYSRLSLCPSPFFLQRVKLRGTSSTILYCSNPVAEQCTNSDWSEIPCGDGCVITGSTLRLSTRTLGTYALSVLALRSLHRSPPQHSQTIAACKTCENVCNICTFASADERRLCAVFARARNLRWRVRARMRNACSNSFESVGSCECEGNFLLR
jgi:hypothetical protein